MKRFLWLVVLCLVVATADAQIGAEVFEPEMYVSPTEYDYTNVALFLTKNSKTKREKARAIYDWICENIAYDTSYSIYTADECYDNKKGVCRAYSELFYRLCEPIGVECYVVSGISKDYDNKISERGHVWIMAEVEDGPILIDPTWGAGFVENNEFRFREDHSYWFDVDPYWMIFSHFPKQEEFQCLVNPIDEDIFRALPYAAPAYGILGWDAYDIYHAIRTHRISTLPRIYETKYGSMLRCVDVPLQNTLNPATKYHFEVEKKEDVKLAIVINKRFVYDNEWIQSGDRYSIDLLPEEGGELHISVRNSEGRYSWLASYHVSTPTADEEEYISTRKRPVIYGKTLDEYGVRLVDVPAVNTLNPAMKYHFEVEKKEDVKLAIVINKRFVYDNEWIQSGDRYSIDLLPEEGGELHISVRNSEGRYSWLASYHVSTPTADEEEYISTRKRPVIYGKTLDEYGVRLVDVPAVNTLNPAMKYHFEVEKKEDVKLAIVINKRFVYDNEWIQSGDRYSIDLLPEEGGELHISVRNSEGRYSWLASYHVSTPTADEEEYISTRKRPVIYGKTLDEYGVRLVDVPAVNTLNPAMKYHFEVEKKEDVKLAIVINKRFVYDNEWIQSGDRYSIDLLPEEGGELHISVRNSEGRYSWLASYHVSTPTADEEEYISTRKRPVIYGKTLDEYGVRLVDVPAVNTLNPAMKYHFEVEKKEDVKLAIVINKRFVYDNEWIQSGDRYSIDLLPEEGGELHISVRNSEGRYSWLASYHVSTPTADEEEYISTRKRPVIYGKTLDEYGVRLVDVPAVNTLNPAMKYHFEVDGRETKSFAISLNGRWYKENQWTCTGTTCYIDITPNEEGNLRLYVKKPDGEYMPIAEYVAKNR